jgi:hypothetical protein
MYATPLPDGLLRPENYATCVRPSVPDDSDVPRRKNNRLGPCGRKLRGKAIKKGTAKPEKAFLGKEKHMRFETTWHREMTVKGPRNKRKKLLVDLALVNASAVCVLVACSQYHPPLPPTP